jgi:DNA-binding NarL/FixJ family response regulator
MDGNMQAQRIAYEDNQRSIILPPKIRLLLVDDQPAVRRRLQMRLALEPDLTVVAEAGDGAVALNLAQRLKPDVILMDLEMPGMNGIWATKMIRALVPKAKVVILTLHDNEFQRLEAKAAGAAAFVGKQEADAVLLSTIRQVAKD